MARCILHCHVAETPENVKVYLGGRVAKETRNEVYKEVLDASRRVCT